MRAEIIIIIIYGCTVFFSVDEGRKSRSGAKYCFVFQPGRGMVSVKTNEAK